MQSPGILDLVGLAVTLAFAIPLGAFGVSLLFSGRPLGAVFVGLAALMIAVERYLTNPLDPTDVADAVVDRVTRDDE